jgi:flagellar M-ring protein FliF
LERTIQTIANVKTARVHLVMATDSVFIDRERGAKASVTLRLKHGSLTKEELSSISRLVAGAVDDLKPSDVAIIDADSTQSLETANRNSPGNDSLEQELTRRLVATLGPVVGPDRIRATVNVEYESDSSEESQEKYDPAVSATLTMQHSEETTTSGVAAGGVPGTSSNVPSKQAGSSKGGLKEVTQSSKTDNNTYGVNKITRHVIAPAGGIRRVTAAVLLDDAVDHKQVNGKWVEMRHKRQPEELKLIEELAQAAIGFNSDRGDVISVQNLTFDRPVPMDDQPPTFTEQARKSLHDYSSAVRYASLLLLFVMVYLLMIRPIQKRAFAAPKLSEPVKELPVHVEPGLPAPPDSKELLVKRSQVLKEQLAELVKADPESSTTVVRAWLREETT